MTVVAKGLANVATAAPIGEDGGFLFGSVTKVLTTTMVMQRAERGAVELDDRVVSVRLISRAEEDTVSKPNSATFETTVAASGNNTGIVVPEEVIGQLEAGKRPAVLVDVNGYQYRSTVGVMGGKHMISISAAVRQATGLKGGDLIRVTLTVADAPPTVNLPEDFAQALAANEQARTFFSKLSNSMQRYHIDNINAAKNADTRHRRIDKAVALFRDGRQR